MLKTILPSRRMVVTAARLLLILTLGLGICYPLVLVGAGLVVPNRATGSLIERDGQVIGSRLIGQQFTGAQWFHGRPSASDYDALASNGTNLSPVSTIQRDLVAQRRAAIAAENNIAPDQVPADAVTASASGLDPDISLEYARLQVPRIAAALGLDAGKLMDMVAAHGQFGGDSACANVLELNLALAEAR